MKETALKRTKSGELTARPNSNRKSYLIRFWRKSENDRWQVTLVSAEGESKTHFSDLESFKEGLNSFINERH